VLRLDAGLHLIEIVAAAVPPNVAGALSLGIWLSCVPFQPSASVEMLSKNGAGDQWLTGADTLLAVCSPVGGALLMATAFGLAKAPGTAPGVNMRSLAGGAISRMTGAAPETAARESTPPRRDEPVSGGESEIRIEVSAHIERVGDRTFAGAAWVGTPGEQRRVEGFAICSLQELRPNEIEYKVVHPGGIETPWTPGPQFCGSRGRSLAITGFFIRLASHVQDQFSVVYQGAFVRSGLTDVRSNGAPCLPRLAGDILEGVNIRVVRRQT